VNKEAKLLPFMIPGELVDQYVVEYYRIWRGGASNIVIDEVKCVYHVNTSWDKYFPNNKGGMDIVNAWMVFVNGQVSGRILSWEGILKADPERMFITKDEAIRAAIEIYGRLITYSMECTQGLQDKKLGLEGSL